MSHGIYEWVMAHMNGSWHIWMGRGVHEWVMSYMNESWYLPMRELVCILLCRWMSDVEWMSESFVYMYMDESYTCKRMSHTYVYVYIYICIYINS